MSKDKHKDEIMDLCEQAGCSDKVKKIHFDQYVYRQWNSHPSQGFVDWWSRVGPCQTEKRTGRAWLGIDVVRAFNCESVRETYRESKQFGITLPVPK